MIAIATKDVPSNEVFTADQLAGVRWRIVSFGSQTPPVPTLYTISIEWENGFEGTFYTRDDTAYHWADEWMTDEDDWSSEPLPKWLRETDWSQGNEEG